MCQRTCDRATQRISSLCDACIDDAYHFDTFVEGSLATINATPATEEEYREHVEDTTFSAEEWREEQKREAALDGYSV